VTAVANRPSDGRPFASRGGDKLDGALDTFGIDVGGMRVLDAGASSGGFTDCLLRRGASEVVAVDVAYGQLAWELRNDPRVRVVERTNIRKLPPSNAGSLDLIVADLSFISLASLADTFNSFGAQRVILLVKPQFELPRAQVPKGGVVREAGAWTDAMMAVARAYRGCGYALADATPSTLVGPKGNREFFLHLVRGATDVGDTVIETASRTAP
jgi:23S rRNA (cytidine1920-2'-O)/16S rRNA (cytidine1409-2'-O)-methyltransferase